MPQYKVGDQLKYNNNTVYTVELVDDYNYYLSYPGLIGPPGPWEIELIDGNPSWVLVSGSKKKWIYAGICALGALWVINELFIRRRR